MKRLALPVLVAIVLTIALAAFHEFTDPYRTSEIWRYWILFVSMWACGIIAALLLAYLIMKILKITPATWTDQNLRAAVLLILLGSLLFGSVAEGMFSKALSFRLFGSPLTVLRIHVSDTFGMLGFVSFLVVLVYVLYRIVERNRRPAGRVVAEKRNTKERFALLIKLAVAGIVVMILSLWIGNTETSREMQLGFLDRKWNTEQDSVIRILTFDGHGASYRQYLETMQHVSEKLHNVQAKTVIIPLPEDLDTNDVYIDLVRQMSDVGNVVFAIPAGERGPEPGFSVDPPFDNKIALRWGVISAWSLPSHWWWPREYFPLAYHEGFVGPVVPDVALVAAGRYWGGGVRVQPNVKGGRLSVGNYSAPVSGDGGVQILHRIYPFSPYQFYAKANDVGNSIQFAIGGPGVPIRSSVSDAEWGLLRSKIVIVEAGDGITRISNFAWTYANIIHNILSHQYTTPLGAWTPFILALVLILVGSLLVLLRTWLAILSCGILAIVQGQFASWLAMDYGIGVEFIAPIAATILGLFAFSFVLVVEERRQMDKREKTRLLDELKAAHDMQMGLMPTEDPKIPGFDISGLSIPADEVGGDFFDYVWLDDKKTKLGIALGDVSGKAMKAAITAVLTSGMVYREVGADESPKSILRKINRPIYLKTDRRMFTAMTFAVIDIRKRTLTFSNAGQMQPMLKRNGKIQLLKVSGIRVPLGMMEEADYQEVAVKLRSNDLILFYTDGVVEAMNEKKELFGFERVESIVKNASPDRPAKQTVTDIVQHVKAFNGGTVQHDDMTVVVVRVAR